MSVPSQVNGVQCTVHARGADVMARGLDDDELRANLGGGAIRLVNEVASHRRVVAPAMPADAYGQMLIAHWSVSSASVRPVSEPIFGRRTFPTFVEGGAQRYGVPDQVVHTCVCWWMWARTCVRAHAHTHAHACECKRAHMRAHSKRARMRTRIHARCSASHERDVPLTSRLK